MIPVLRFKPQVTIVPSPGGARILSVCDQATGVLGRDITITAGSNGHTVGKHPVGEAFDLSVAGLQSYEVRKLVVYLKGTLGPLFYVQYEVRTEPTEADLLDIATVNPHASAPHVHVQVRKGTTFPPIDAPETGVPV